MAARPLGWTGFDELGRSLGADGDRERAALDEAAACDRVDAGVMRAPDRDVLEPQAGPRIGDGREEQARVRVQRVLQHCFGRPLLDDLPGVHDEHLVGDVAGAREVVRDVEEREVAILLEREHQVQDPDPDRDVEHRGRLVGEDHARLDRERAGDRDALALSAGELVRVLARDVLRRHEPDRLQQLVHALADLLLAARCRGSGAAARCGARRS